MTKQTTALSPTEEQSINLNDPSLYINRELGWADFNARVLDEALDEHNPLLERVKFLAIFSSNLDEFFMIRVAGLKQQIAAGVTEPSVNGMTPTEQLIALREKILPIQSIQRQCWKEDIVPALAKHRVYIQEFSDVTAKQKKALHEYFQTEIYPVLTPLAVDPGRPFPHISNLSLNLAIMLRDKQGQSHFARVKIPTGKNISRIVSVKDVMDRYGEKPSRSKHVYVFLGEIIRANLDILFPGMEIEQAYFFRVTRDADVEIAEDEASDLLETIEQGVRQRRFGQVVRLTVEKTMPTAVRMTLLQNLDATLLDLYEVSAPLGLADVFTIADLDIPELKYPNFVPRHPEVFASSQNIFHTIRQQDILLHHPYDSFTPTIDFIRAAAHDPDVLAIKTTLYRVGSNSPVVTALLEAMEAGKQVAVLVELKARFDEENNIIWARALESQGVHVVYGLLGLKTHTKVALVVRREQDGIQRYVHLSTGNYNVSTARQYTDLALFTCRTDLAEDVTELFNRLTGYAPSASYKKLLVAPEHMRSQFEKFIDREIEHAKAGRKAYIIIKSNSLTDEKMIRKLYQASQAGVKIDMIIRGICSLKPGIEGVSENIRVRSIIGRFLEHSRIYWFANHGDPEVYIGSADLMDRNLNRRVETVFPIEDTHLKSQIYETILKVQLADNVRARVLQPDGTWIRLSPGKNETPLDSQKWAMRHSKATRY